MKTKHLKIYQTFLLLFFFGIFNIAYAQSITDVKIIPPNPTENDTVKIQVFSTHPNAASVLNYSFGVTTLHINYCYDSIPVITNRIDTFSVGAKLVADTYNLSIILIVDTPCSPSLKTDTFDITFTVTLVNAIIENQFQDNYTTTVYPNPFSNSITIEVSDSYFTKGDLIIYDLIGQTIYHQTLNSKLETLNLQLPNNMYFYQIKDKNKEIGRGKIIKQ